MKGQTPKADSLRAMRERAHEERQKPAPKTPPVKVAKSKPRGKKR